ncbi:MAG: hypothetical protein PUP93_28575 [Rhizonema sp. NSF051]|nr:hypothetical protein [Rhizonema sp. NSF051]
MFGDNLPANESNNSNGSSILKSGYDPKAITGTQKLRGDFKQALELNPTNEAGNTASTPIKILWLSKNSLCVGHLTAFSHFSVQLLLITH